MSRVSLCVRLVSRANQHTHSTKRWRRFPSTTTSNAFGLDDDGRDESVESVLSIMYRMSSRYYYEEKISRFYVFAS